MINTLKQMGLELGRVIALAVIAYLLTEGVLTTLIGLTGLTLSPDIKLQVITFLTLVLKGFDRALHESGVAERGITRF